MLSIVNSEWIRGPPPYVHYPRSSGTKAHRGTTGASKPNQDSDTKLVEMINTVIVDRSPFVRWDDIAGLDKAKQTLFEMVILPTKRRDLFTGLRRPPRGMLLFGAPGNGKPCLLRRLLLNVMQHFSTFLRLL